MRTLKILLSTTIIFVMALGSVYGQNEKSIVVAKGMLGAEALSLNTQKRVIVAEEEEDALVKLNWTRERIMSILAQTRKEAVKNTNIIKAIRATNKLMRNVFNPDMLDITYIHLDNDFLTLRYGMGLTEITVHVDMNTYEPFIKYDSQYADAALKTRGDIAIKMGLYNADGTPNTEDVHINGIEPYFHILYADNEVKSDELLVWPYPVGVECQLTARVGNYTLRLDYSKYSYPWIGYDPYGIDGATGGEDYIVRPWPPYRWTTVTLKSFVDNTTGRDLVKDAQDKILDLFNPENHSIGVSYWTMENGMLKLNINLFQSKTYYPFRMMRIGSIISVEVDLQTGEIKIDEKIVDAVTKIREETSKRLGLDIDDVHVNGIQPELVLYMTMVYPPRPIPPRYYLVFVSADKFDLTYKYNIGNGTIELTSLVNTDTGDKLLENAIGYLKEILNPDSFELDGWMLNGDRLTVSFLLPDGSIIKMGVDVNTGEPFMSESLKDAALRTREDIARKMGLYDSYGNLNIGEVHINRIERPLYAIFSDNSTETEYQITARVDNYTLTLDYVQYGYAWHRALEPGGADDIGDPIFEAYPPYRWTAITLKSFVDNITGKDYVKEAQEEILNLFNPEEHNIGVSYWSMEGGVLKLNIDLSLTPGLLKIWGSHIPVEVNLETGEIKIDQNIVDAVTKAREETSKRLGLDPDDVHVNGIRREFIYYIMAEGYPAPEPPYIINVSTPEFNLTYNYSPKDGSLKLISLVNKETGQNLLKNAVDYLKEILNPDEFELYKWGMKYAKVIDADYLLGGTVMFSFKLKDGSIVTIWVDEDGKPHMSDQLKDAALEIRSEIASRIGVDIGEVHINGVRNDFIVRAFGGEVHYRLTTRVNQFTITMDYIKLTWFPERPATVTLTSLVNNETGQDLLKNAIDYLKEIFNPDEYELAHWVNNGSISFVFKLKDSSMVVINVNTNTGEPWMRNDLKDAALKTREEIAERMGIDIGEVHINGINNIVGILDDGRVIEAVSIPAHYKVTARVGNYALKLDYNEYSYPWYYEYPMPKETDSGIIVRPWPWPPYRWTTITLKSFVDNITGRDYVKEAQEEILNLFNPEEHNIGVSYWSMEGGVLKLNINLFQSETYYPFRMIKMGSIVSVEADLQTGEIKIDEKIVDAVIKTREETAKRLGLDINDVHVNGIQPEIVFYILHVYPPQPIPPSYYWVFVSTDKFNLTYKYNFADANLEVTKLANKETGVDLVRSTKSDMVDRFGFEYSLIHINDFSADELSGEMKFTIKVDGRDETYIYKVDAKTGDIISIIIGVKIGDEDVFIDIANTTLSVEEIIKNKEIRQAMWCVFPENATNFLTNGNTDPNFDLNNDGLVNALDYAKLRDIVTMEEAEFRQVFTKLMTAAGERLGLTVSDEDYSAGFDVDGDGDIDMDDYNRIAEALGEGRDPVLIDQLLAEVERAPESLNIWRYAGGRLIESNVHEEPQLIEATRLYIYENGRIVQTIEYSEPTMVEATSKLIYDNGKIAAAIGALPLTPPASLDYPLSVFDQDGDGAISPDEAVRGVQAFMEAFGKGKDDAEWDYYKRFDFDGDNGVGLLDYGPIMEALQGHMSERDFQAYRALTVFDEDGDAAISLDEAAQGWQAFKEAFGKDKDDLEWDYYKRFNFNGDEGVSIWDGGPMLRVLQDYMSEADFQAFEALYAVDQDGDGVISLNEVVRGWQAGNDQQPDDPDAPGSDMPTDDGWMEIIQELLKQLEANKASANTDDGGARRRKAIESEFWKQANDSRFSKKGPTRANDTIPWLRRKTQIR